MKKSIFTTFFFVLVPTLVFSASKQEIGVAIESKYELTKRSTFSGQVKKPGTVLYVSQSGLQANKPSALLKPTIIKNGEIDQAGGGSIIPGSAGKLLKVGDQMYLYSYKVGKDAVTFLSGTVDSHDMEVNGTTKMQPYQLAVRFEYDGGLAAVETKQILDDLAAYFSTDQEVARSDEGTIKLGQTPQQVIEIMGPPKRKVDLGGKQIFTYDDLKIVFKGGVVVDVE